MEFKNGLNAEKSAYGTGTRFVNVMDIFSSSELHAENIAGLVKVSEKAAHEYGVEFGDVLFNRTSETPDDIAHASVYLDRQPITFGGFVIRGRQTSGLLDPEFCKYAFRADAVRRELIRRCQGAVRANIGQKDLGKVPVGIPPLPEQRKIAEILQTWDEALEKLLALRTAKTKSRAARLQLVLNNPDWPEISIEKLGMISSAGVDKKLVEGEMPVRLLNFVDVMRRDFLYNSQFIHHVTAPKRKVDSCDVRKGDIFFTPSSETRDDIAYSAVAMETMPGVVYSYHVIRLRPSLNLDLTFRAYLFKSSHFLKQAYALAAGSGQRYVLSQDQFRRMNVRLPNRKMQEKISAYFAAVDREIAFIDDKIQALTRQKRGLMQKLLTGEWRVKLEKHDV